MESGGSCTVALQGFDISWTLLAGLLPGLVILRLRRR